MIAKFNLSTYQDSIRDLLPMGWSPLDSCRSNTISLLCDDNKFDTVRKGIFIFSPNITVRSSTYQDSIRVLILMGWSRSAYRCPNTKPLLWDDNKFDTVRREICILSPNNAESQVQSFNLRRFDRRLNSEGMVPVSSLLDKSKISVKKGQQQIAIRLGEWECFSSLSPTMLKAQLNLWLRLTNIQ
jgi:hypothetical protein